jgi:hypothetical protein
MNISIGDIHGKNVWKKFINKNFDNFYFVGDYFDTFEPISANEQIENFNEICCAARKDSRFHLCLGNHDFHYLRGLKEQYSGFQFYKRLDIQEVIEKNLDLINPVYQYKDYLISHAGISKTFLNSLCLTNPLDINKRFEEHRMSLAFCGYNQYGDNITQGPLWIRPGSLLKDKLDNYKQIVGHTKVKNIETKDEITFIDCLDSKIDCFEFE